MYKQHCENLTEIEGAINLVQLDLRRYISTEKESFVFRYTKLLSYLITCWSEVRILKLVYEPSGFSPQEINSIISAGTLELKWLTALEISICKAYNINRNLDISNQLPFTARSYYIEIRNLIQDELVPSIEIRNRIAHGQWKIAFTGDLTSISTPLTGKLRQENIVQLQLKNKLFTGIALIIHDLAVSPPTFERDFDENYKLVEENKRNLHNRTYVNYKQSMIAKYQRGQLLKAKPDVTFKNKELKLKKQISTLNIRITQFEKKRRHEWLIRIAIIAVLLLLLVFLY